MSKHNIKVLFKYLFGGRTENEKVISKLESRLINLKQKRNFLIPRVRRKLFGGYETEVVPISRLIKIEKYNEEIQILEEELNNLRNI